MKASGNQNDTFCHCTVIHENVVKKVIGQMPKEDVLLEVAEFFRVFGDSTRLRILAALVRSEMCGCDLCAVLNMSQSAVSHQLRLLKQARLVRSRREGKMVYFRLDDDHIDEIVQIGIAHVTE